MTNKTIFSGMLVLLLTFGLVLAGCEIKEEDDDSIPSALVGEWASKSVPTTMLFKITSDGTFTAAGQIGGNFDKLSVSGNTVELQYNGAAVGTFNYSISNGEMTMTNATGSATLFSPFSPFVKISGNNNGGNGGGGGNINIGERLSANNAPLFYYDDDTGNVIPFVSEGSMDLEWEGVGMFDADYFPITASIANNTISFDTGAVPTLRLGALGSDFTSSTPSVRGGAIIFCFYYEKYYEDDDSWEFLPFLLTNRNNISEIVGFVYVDRDAEITGFDDWMYWELSLKNGWNSVKFNFDSETVQTFTPDNNYVWLTGGFGFDEDPDVEEDAPGGYMASKISGTISVTVDGQFPAGGFTLEARGGSGSLGTIEIQPGSNPASWEFDIPEDARWGGVYFVLTIYPAVGRSTFFEYRPSVQVWGEQHLVSENEYGEGVYEITDIVLQSISVNTITVPLTVTGFGSNPTVYADGNGWALTSSWASKYGMTAQGSNPHSFRLPSNIGLNRKDENWLWFMVVPASGQTYITKGRFNAALPVTLNIADMYPVN